ncbi:MAG: hypothetical protein OEU50_19835 [Gammaproteobacteria bacterium]|nr:hypothetical protein [Gammaproteobacteria bacterium]
MPRYLGSPIDQAQDGENNRIEFDAAYPVRVNLPAALEELKQKHGADIYLLPMSGTSCGGGIFQAGNRSLGPIVGLRFDPPANPRIRLAALPRLAHLELDEIVIDQENRQVGAGAAITLDQLNQALAHRLGHNFKVPGADLTSYMYAAVGATFMTGGMGPQRRYFSDSVVEAAIHDGEEIREISGDALQGYAGTYGWSGIVSALRCDYYRFPENEIAFALPVGNTPAALARLLEHLSAYTYLKLDKSGVRSEANQNDLILGLEHVSSGSMQPLLRDGSTNPMATKARELKQKCSAAGADGLIFINGFSDRSIDEFLIDLADDSQLDELSIAGIDLEHAEVFADAEQMRAVREAIPYEARMQSPAGKLVYKNHSDANIRVAADDVAACVRQIWKINCDYVAAVEAHFDANPGVDGQILVYGHLNPYGIDPHNRVTLGSDDEAAFQRSRDFLIAERARYYRALAHFCSNSDSTFVGGEKTADSEIAIFQALDGPQNSPVALYRRFQRQQQTVAAAAPMFNWRALPPYI